MTKTDQDSPPVDTLVTFWGVRGSLAAPGEQTAHYGGNTSCVEVRSGEHSLLFDAGTGIRAAGSSMMARGKKNISLLFSHLHWDHIQGFPFFTPAYVEGTSIDIFGPAPESELRNSLGRQMRPPNFPIRFEDLKSEIRLFEMHPGGVRVIGGMRVVAQLLNHPGGVLGYRVETEGGTVVYSTDHEHGTDADERLIKLAQGADILIYDAMYTPDEYIGKESMPRKGWGHSTYEEAARVASSAGVKKLVLFHHDPERTDDALEDVVERAQALFPQTVAAREGSTLIAGAPSPPSARPRRVEAA